MRLMLQSSRAINNRLAVGDFMIFILSILIVISEVPILSRNVSNVVFYGLVFVFLVSGINVIFRLEKRKWETIVLLCLYLIMLAIYKIFSISSADLAYYSTTVKFFFFLVAMLIVVEHMTKTQMTYILGVILSSMLFTVIDNIRLYLMYGPSVYVHLFQWERFTTNSVNTTFVSSMLFACGALLIAFFNTRNKLIKCGSIAFIVLSLYFIARIAQRMIIFGLAIIMLPLIMLYNEKYSFKRICITLVFVACALLLLINFEWIISKIDGVIRSERLHLRFEQLKILFSTKNAREAGGTLSARVELFLRSINTWFSSFGTFLFGAGDHRITNDIIGNHSDYIDDCARYGLLGMMIWIPFTVSYMKSIIKCSSVKKSSPLSRQIKVIICIFILNALLSDVYEATVGIQMFLMIPIVCSLIRQNKVLFFEVEV